VLKFTDNEKYSDYKPPKFYHYYDSDDIQYKDIPSTQSVHEDTVAYLEKTGCLHLVNPMLIVQYSILLTRWFECEHFVANCIIMTGNGGVYPNPFMAAALQYKKAVDSAWADIWKIIAQNCEEHYGGHDPQTAMMEKLLQKNMRTG